MDIAARHERPVAFRALLAVLVLSGIAAWALCIGYFFSGDGTLDHFRDAYARDFINFWAAGHLAVAGLVQDIFDPARLTAAQQALYHPRIHGHFWSYPPPALLIVYPLGFLPYFTALALWTMASFAALAWAARTLFSDLLRQLLLLCCPAMAASVMVGQNGAFTAALLLGGLVCLERRPVLGGVLLGLLVFKPQLAVMLPVAALAMRRWDTIAAAIVTVLAVALLSTFVFGLQSWQAFIDYTLPAQIDSLEHGGGFLVLMPSAFASARLLGLYGEAIWVQLPFALLAAVLVWRGCRSERPMRDKITLIVLGTFVATPQAFIYDLVPLAAAPLLLLERRGPGWLMASLYALPLVSVAGVGFGIPIAPLLMAGGLWAAYRSTAACPQPSPEHLQPA